MAEDRPDLSLKSGEKANLATNDVGLTSSSSDIEDENAISSCISEEMSKNTDKLLISSDGQANEVQPQVEDDTEDDKLDKWDKFINRMKVIPFLGIILGLMSSFLLAIQNVIVKQVTSMDPFTIAFFRFLGIAVLANPVHAFRQEKYFPPGRVVPLALRCTIGASAALIHFNCIKYMPLADANMIASAAPIWTVILARIFLKEPLKCFDIVNVFIAIAGILLIIRPPFIFGYDPEFEMDQYYYYAAFAMLAGTLLQAIVFILLRLLRDVHFSVILLMFGTAGTLETGVLMSAFGSPCIPACGTDRVQMLVIGFVAYLAQIMLTVSIKVEEAGKISLVRKAGDVLFAFLTQILFFQEIPGMLSVIGALLICFAVFTSGVQKLINNLPKDHVIKKRYLKFLYQPRRDDSKDMEEKKS